MMHSNVSDSGGLPPLTPSVNTKEEDDLLSGAAGAEVISLYQELRNEESNPAIDDKVKVIGENIERLERRDELHFPSSVGNFRAAVCWMIQQGSDEKDLDAVRRALAELENSYDPHLKRESIRRLLLLAEQCVIERVNDPTGVARRGEEAYRLNREEWEREFKGEFIAIYRGAVIASDADKTELLRKIVALQESWWPFRAYIVQVGAPALPMMRGPGPGMRLWKRHSAETKA